MHYVQTVNGVNRKHLWQRMRGKASGIEQFESLFRGDFFKSFFDFGEQMPAVMGGRHARPAALPGSSGKPGCWAVRTAIRLSGTPSSPSSAHPWECAACGDTPGKRQVKRANAAEKSRN